MSAEEWIDFLSDWINEGYGLSIEELRDIVESISVEDTVAGEDAL